MATITHDEPVVQAPPEPAAPTGLAAGDPSILGLPIFVVGSLALGFSLVGYVPPAAAGSIIPVIFAATGLGLVLSTVWAAMLGQTMVASIFGLFAGFWISFAILLLGLDHAWLLIPATAVVHSVGLFLLSWMIIMAALTVATLRLPVAFTAVIALVVLALIFRYIGVIDASTAMTKLAGYIVFVFAALGIYLFLNAADLATGGRGFPLGSPLRR